MPVGYLVILGDGSLDSGDQIQTTSTTFTTDTNLGGGRWLWSGIDDKGNPQTNKSSKGDYVLGTDGNVYFVPDKPPISVVSAEVANAPAYTVPENNVEGTGGADVIDTSYTDADGDQVDDGTGGGAGGLDDIVRAGEGDDSVNAGDGDDTVYGGGGSDTIDGGSGNDTIYGDTGGGTYASTSESVSWTAAGADEDDASGGVTQTTGEIDLSMSFTNHGNGATISYEHDDVQYVNSGAGEPMDPNSSLALYGEGLGPTSTTTFDFAAAHGSEYSNEVENVVFRINDIDAFAGNHLDVVTVNAYDADGNPVAVTLTPGGADTVSGNTVTASYALDSQADAGGSVLVEIAGPVAKIEVIYSNEEPVLTGGYTGTHAIWITDIHFDTVAPVDGDDVITGGAGDDVIYGEDGDDTITGGQGADTLDGGAGNDTLYVSQGDTASGGDGDDTFILTNEGDTGIITITGGEGGETLGDTLNFNGLLGSGTVVYTDTDDANGGLSGYATLTDGTLVNFSNIENVVCFTPGTFIMTEMGDREIQHLRPGDRILTRDNGLQEIRWIGSSTVPGYDRFAPIEVTREIPGASPARLLVSPQHRFLLDGPQNELFFGSREVLVAAKHMLGNDAQVRPMEAVTYIHLMLDRHEIIYGNGVPTESFHAGQAGLDGMDEAARAEMFGAFPQLRSDVSAYGPSVRRCLQAFEARLLFGPVSAGDAQVMPAYAG